MPKLKSGKKRNPIKTQRNKDIKEWRNRALKRENNKCEWCGKEGPGLNVHHIISRRYKKLLTDDLNNLVLCAKCHRFDIGKAAHENPIRVARYLLINRPVAWNYLLEETKGMISDGSI